jgi:hypothetical protein
MTEIKINPDHVKEIMAGVRDILASQMTRHGASPDRVFDALQAFALVAASIIVGSPASADVYFWFAEALSQAIDEVEEPSS